MGSNPVSATKNSSDDFAGSKLAGTCGGYMQIHAKDRKQAYNHYRLPANVTGRH